WTVTYGAHNKDVQEIIDLVQTGWILHNPRPPKESPNIRIIRDIRHRDDFERANDIDDGIEWIWRDILNDAGNCGSLRPVERMERLSKEVGEQLPVLSNDMCGVLASQLSGMYEERIIANILNLLDIVV